MFQLSADHHFAGLKHDPSRKLIQRASGVCAKNNRVLTWARPNKPPDDLARLLIRKFWF